MRLQELPLLKHLYDGDDINCLICTDMEGAPCAWVLEPTASPTPQSRRPKPGGAGERREGMVGEAHLGR